MDQESKFRSGYVAIVGRPNAGKSTLLNRLVGEKIAAVSNKPQTTRHRIQGIVTRHDGQIVFVDTPGVHKPGHLLNRRMMAAVHDAILSVDAIVLMRDASVSTGNGDRFVLELIKKDRQSGVANSESQVQSRKSHVGEHEVGEEEGGARPVILVLNKIDKIHEKHQLLPLIDWYRQEYDFAEIIPVSALKGDAVDDLLSSIVKHLPPGEPIFHEDELTDQPLRQIVAEMVREKILTSTGEEIPYVTAVVTEKWDDENPEITEIYCAIFVERSSQKPIIIGKGGSRIRDVGTAARQDIERLLGKKVFLKLFVKVVEDWRNRERELDEMGIHD